MVKFLNVFSLQLCQRRYCLFWLCLIKVSLIATPVYTLFSSASFHGDSFTFEQLTDFSSDSTISLQFQTRLPSGVIFAAVGQTDYLAILLKHGKLEVHLKVGNEEGLLRSSSGVHYDNQLWHRVDLFRIGCRIDLRVNGKDLISDEIFDSSADSLLKIDLGVFLGGYDLKVVAANQFDISVPFFRGCIFTAIFNGVDVLHPLHSITNEKVVYNIKAGCSKILRARSTEPMKMVSQFAYLKYPRWTDDAEGTFECQLKTRHNNGLLLFNDGWKRHAFVGLEMVGGRIRGSLHTGAGVVALQSTESVNDGRWHRVRPKSYTDILASHDVEIGCSQSDATEPSQVKPPSLPTFIIVPREPDPTPDVTITVEKERLPMSICHYLKLYNLTVEEGGSRTITTQTISIGGDQDLDAKLQDNQLFAIRFLSLPHHGQLFVDREPVTQNRSYFTNVIHENRLYYEHDDSESLVDDFTFTLATAAGMNSSSAENKIFHHFCDKNMNILNDVDVTFTIDVTIKSVNDPPSLEIPANYIFEPIWNTRTPLPASIFSARDPDNSPVEILYHVLGLGTGLYIEHSDSPGRLVSGFSQEDINAKKVNFVHAGGSRHARMLIQISNPEQEVNAAPSSTVVRISSKPLQIFVVNNTGATLVEGEWFIFTPSQLFSQTNAGQSIVNVEYDVIGTPLFGGIQVLRGNQKSTSTWSHASSFLQSQLEDGRIRYINLNATNDDADTFHDSFSFTVSDCGVSVGPYTFNISVLRVRVNLETSPIVLKDGRDQVFLSTDFLSLRYSGLQQLSDDNIQFEITNPFSFAVLSLKDTGFILSTGDVFTMVDLKTERLLVLVLTQQIPSDLPRLEDSLTLNALVQNRYRSAAVSLKLTFIPDVTAIKLTTETLEVDEGGEVLIDEDHLFAETLIHQRFTFHVTQSPFHGHLMLHDESLPILPIASDSGQQSNSITSFTTRDILDGKLYYRHDDSETLSDFFRFEVTPILSGELLDTIELLQNVSANGLLNFSVSLLNDNTPFRMINQPFKVVRHGQRLLTRHDLWYHDPDINQDDLSIKFIRRGMTNGDILSAISNKEVFEFSQEDILKNKILFRHKKNDFGRFVFWVKDDSGTVATGLFIVTASQPFIEIANFSKLLVQKGTNAMITNSNIQANTNVVGLTTAIRYRITKPPSHGNLRVGNVSDVIEFSQADVDNGLLTYQHNGFPDVTDSVDYIVTANDQSTNGSLEIHVYLASQQQPPEIRRNRVLVVHQSKSVTLERADLRVTHPDVRPRDITFSIREVPSHAYFLLNQTILVDGTSVAPRLVKNVTTFSQWDINQGHVMLIQSSNVTFDPVNPVDNFTFDVSNGILSLAKVIGRIEVIPSTIPLRVSNFSVGEGRSRVLISKYLDIPNRHFDDLDINTDVIKQPTNGMLESSRDPGERLEEFSFRLVRAEFVFYTHDGSDTLLDAFQLQARTSGGLESYVVTCYVTILPDNDQAPEMANNTGLQVWINSITPLTSTELAAVDLDSPPSNLSYDILPPQNGFLALTLSLIQPIFNFTQEHINRREVVFCHEGSNAGGFTFQVNDGRNFDSKHIFVITARLLVISMVDNNQLLMFPHSLAPITSHNLMAATNDEKPRDLIYEVIGMPTYGMIVKIVRNISNQTSATETEYVAVDSFLQSELDSGVVFFNQSKEISQWTTSDSFQFKIKSFPAEEMKNLLLKINISYDSYRLIGRNSSVKTNEVGTVDEGGSFNLTVFYLDASNLYNKLDDTQKLRYVLRYRIVTSPLHGHIYVAGRLLSTNDSFLHRFIEQAIVKYANDGSENPQDSFVFEAYLQHKGQASRRYPFTITDRFNITVNPVNDNPPLLITKNPHLEIVRGFVAVINSSHLLATDLDNPAADIRYKVIQAPKHGKLHLYGQETTIFTQQDVNENKLKFIQNPHEPSQFDAEDTDITSDAFYFGLTDGLHRPIYTLFIIKIFPVVVELKTKPLLMKQGEVSALITTEIVEVRTNGDSHQLFFNVSSVPEAGNLYVGDRQVTSFTYDDLLTLSITYVMNDLSHDRDQMTIIVSYNSTDDNYHINETAPLNVTVKARMKLGFGLQFSTNTTHSITLDALDANELANFSNSMPEYEVLESARHTQILVQWTELEKKDSRQPVRRHIAPQTFSHDDVVSGNVFLVVGSVNLENVTSVQDQFVFKLGVTDGSVQPVRCVFTFEIVPLNHSNIIFTPLTTTALSATEWSTNQSTANTSPSILPTSNHLFVPIVNTTAAPSVAITLPIKSIEGLDTKEEPKDSKLLWLIPLIILLALLLIFLIAIISYWVIRSRRQKRSLYIGGQESSTLRASSIILAAPEHHLSTIDADTVVKVSSSREDTLEVAQQCPTASVVVTPLRKSPSRPPEDHGEAFDVGYYGDDYMSNSMPPEGVLSSAEIQGLSVARNDDVTMPSPYGLSDFPPGALGDLDHYNSLPRSGHHAVLSSNDSVDSADIFPPPHHRRNVSSGSLPLTNTQLSTPALELNQYWV